MKRRDFIRTSCLACAGVIGGSLLSSVLASCSTLPVYKAAVNNNRLEVPLSQFELQNMVTVRHDTLEYDILLVKQQDGTFKALYLQCTHQNQPLTTSKTGIFCNSHGSAFDFNGEVTREPAALPLRQFKTLADTNNVYITL